MVVPQKTTGIGTPTTTNRPTCDVPVDFPFSTKKRGANSKKDTQVVESGFGCPVFVRILGTLL